VTTAKLATDSRGGGREAYCYVRIGEEDKIMYGFNRLDGVLKYDIFAYIIYGYALNLAI